ncbi:MAG: HD domain-containing protein [Nitrospirota bacterium]|nr:HD domain-containing protein [Nitrospirota bacterium]
MTISDFKEGDTLEGQAFYVQAKQTAVTKSGNPFLSLKLNDKGGSIDAKIWDAAEQWGRLFEEGDYVSVNGKVGSFNNTLQLSIKALRRLDEAEVRVEDFLPVSKRDREEMFHEFLVRIERFSDPWLRRLLESVFRDDEIAERFKRAPAAKGMHHVWIGGLLEHTLELVMLADDVLEHFPAVNRDLLIAGAMLHDLGKIWEYSYGKAIDYTTEGRLLGHISMTIDMLGEKIRGMEGFPAETAMLLKHLILSHHGELEFGSPKRPKTLEAIVLHYLDDLCSKVNNFLSIMEKERVAPGEWSSYQRMYERPFYFGQAPEYDSDGEGDTGPTV